MTKQEFLDLLVATSRGGGFPSVRKSPTPASPMAVACLYRDDDGRACAVGLLIPDECYRPTMECGSAKVLFSTFPELKRFIPDGVTVDDLNDVQTVHDSLSGRNAWDHNAFVEAVLRAPCFSGLRPTHPTPGG